MDDQRLHIQVRKSRNGTKVALDGELTIYTAAAVRERLLRVLENCARLTLDTAKVSEIDTAGLQVLLSTRRSCQEGGVPFAFPHSGQAVGQTLTLFGLGERLEFTGF